MKKLFSFEIEIKDKRDKIRRFRCSNFTEKSRLTEEICTLPLKMDEGWNLIQIDLEQYVRTAYNTDYSETLRVTFNATTRIRRVYFSERLYSEEELPTELKIYVPTKN